MDSVSPTSPPPLPTNSAGDNHTDTPTVEASETKSHESPLQGLTSGGASDVNQPLVVPPTEPTKDSSAATPDHAAETPPSTPGMPSAPPVSPPPTMNLGASPSDSHGETASLPGVPAVSSPPAAPATLPPPATDMPHAMDTNEVSQPPTNAAAQAAPTPAAATDAKPKKHGGTTWLIIFFVIVLIAGAVIYAGTSCMINIPGLSGSCSQSGQASDQGIPPVSSQQK